MNLELRNNTKLDRLCLCSMESLDQECVWESFPAKFGEDWYEDIVSIDTTGSPNIHFNATCYLPVITLNNDTIPLGDSIKVSLSRE